MLTVDVGKWFIYILVMFMIYIFIMFGRGEIYFWFSFSLSVLLSFEHSVHAFVFPKGILIACNLSDYFFLFFSHFFFLLLIFWKHLIKKNNACQTQVTPAWSSAGDWLWFVCQKLELLISIVFELHSWRSLLTMPFPKVFPDPMWSWSIKKKM